MVSRLFLLAVSLAFTSLAFAQQQNNQAPQAVTVNPLSGSGTGETFVTYFSDANGAGDIRRAQVIFNGSPTPAGSCDVIYYPGPNTLALYQGAAWSPAVMIGSAATLQNNQCTLNVGNSSAVRNGNYLGLTLSLVFNTAWAGVKNIYMFADDLGGMNTGGWQLRGYYTVRAAGNLAAPQALSVTTHSGNSSGNWDTFAVHFSDANGASDIRRAQAIFSASQSPVGACDVMYYPGSNTLSLYLDGFWSKAVTVGTAAATLQNNQCTLNVGESSVVRNGNDLTVDLVLAFSGAWAGIKNIYLFADDLGGLSTGSWKLTGTYTVENHVRQLAAGKNPEGMVVNPVTHKAYIVAEVDNPDRQVVMVFDDAARRGTSAPKLIQIPDETEYITVDPSRNRIYLSTRYGLEQEGTGDAPSPAQPTVLTLGTLTVIDGNTDTLLASYQFPEGVEPEGVAVDVHRNIVYVGIKAPNPEPANGACPWGTFFIDEDGEEECWTAGSIVAFNGADITTGPIKTIPAGDDPESVVFTNDMVYAANEDDGTVTIARAVNPDGTGGELVTDTPAYSPALPPYSLGVFYGFGPNTLACPDKRYEADKMAVGWDSLAHSVYITDDRSRVAKIQGADVVGGTAIPLDPILGQCIKTPISDENGLNTANNIAFMRCPKTDGATSSRSAVYVVSEQGTVAVLDPLTMKLRGTITVPNAVHLDAIGVDGAANRVWITDEVQMAVFVLPGVCKDDTSVCSGTGVCAEK